MKPQKVHKRQMVETMISLSSNRSPVIKNAHCKSTKCKMQKSQYTALGNLKMDSQRATVQGIVV